jgi:predicted RecA/RadA family phage recombinase
VIAAWAPAQVGRLAAVAGVAVLVAGIAGEITHIGAFFIPALVLLAIGAVLLWGERSRAGSAAAAG